MNTLPPAGWYPDPHTPNSERYWDGAQWTSNVRPAQASIAPQVAAKAKPTYVREQKGHSIIKHVLLIIVGIGLFTIPYYSISKNHYWHL